MQFFSSDFHFLIQQVYFIQNIKDFMKLVEFREATENPYKFLLVNNLHIIIACSCFAVD